MMAILIVIQMHEIACLGNTRMSNISKIYLSVQLGEILRFNVNSVNIATASAAMNLKMKMKEYKKRGVLFIAEREFTIRPGCSGLW